MLKSKLTKIFSYPFILKVIIAKAFIYSFFYEIWLKTNNFKKIKSLHDLVNQEKHITYSSEELEKIYFTKKAITILKKYALWSPKCYNQALTVRKILGSYEIKSIFSIGFKKNDEKIEGHAWVNCNQIYVCGFLKNINSFNRLHSE